MPRYSAEEQALGRSKGGFSTKIHAIVDGLVNPLRFILTSGNQSEFITAEALIEGIRDTNIITDKGYDSDKFCQQIAKQNCICTIP